MSGSEERVKVPQLTECLRRSVETRVMLIMSDAIASLAESGEKQAPE